MPHKFTVAQTVSWCVKEWENNVRPVFDSLLLLLKKPKAQIPAEKFLVLLPPDQRWNPLFKFVRPNRANEIVQMRVSAKAKQWAKVQDGVITPYFAAWHELLRSLADLGSSSNTIMAVQNALGMLQRYLSAGDGAVDAEAEFNTLKRYFVRLPQSSSDAAHTALDNEEFVEKVQNAAHAGAKMAAKSVKMHSKAVLMSGIEKVTQYFIDCSDAKDLELPMPKKPKHKKIGHPEPDKKKQAIILAAANASADTAKGKCFACVSQFYDDTNTWVVNKWIVDGKREFFAMLKGEKTTEKAKRRLYAAVKYYLKKEIAKQE